MKNTGKGETSTIEQSKVDEPVEITNKKDLNRLQNMKKDDVLKVTSIETPLYKNLKGYWTPMTEDDNSKKEIKLKKGDLVIYQGKYETFENAETGDKIAYLQIKTSDGKDGYVRLAAVELVMTTNTTMNTNKLEPTNTDNKINPDKLNISKTNSTVVTSRAKTSDKTIGKENENYTIAIAAGRDKYDDDGISNDEKNLKEEELTIKVTEKVEKMLKEYSNVKVIQTGSTSEDKSGISSDDRNKKARNANPDLCIQVYFRDGETPGVETIYKEGDDISAQLADILAKNISNSMGLTNLNAGADTEKCKDAEGNSASLSIIENAAVTGFPSVVVLGGNLTKDPDASIIAGEGVDKYAQGIVKSIDEYFKADRSGRTATENEKTTYKDSTESRIINMKYVSPEKLQKYVDDGDFENALKSYTIDENRNLVIVTWSQKEDGSIELTTNNSMSLKTALKKYVMPYEYLLYFYMDTDYKGFVKDLADEVMNSEIVIAVQDNVTTTNTIETTQQKTEATVDKFDVAWHETNKKNTTVENVSTSVDITYVSTWCVKAYQENSYSKAVLEMGEEDEKIVNVPGKVTETTSSSTSSENIIVDNEVGKYTEIGVNLEGNYDNIEKVYNYTVYERIQTDIHSISNSYEKGEYKTEGRENVFVKLYNKHYMSKRVRTADYLFKIIEENEKTANLLDLTKYLIYKATNIPWGVLEFDYEGEFALSSLSSFSGIYGGTIQEKIWFSLRDLGYSEISAAAALGNMEIESGGFQVDAVNPSSGASGLAQWLGGRKTALDRYAASKGLTWKDEDTQIEFLITEITGQGSAVGYATQRTMGYILSEHIIGTYTKWANATSIDDATIEFMRFFESPGNRASYNQRLTAANKYYNEFKGKTKPAGDSRIGTIKLSGDNATKMQQMLNEAIRIADDDRYTYSQPNRDGEFQYDCSSLVYGLYQKYFGFNAPGNTHEYHGYSQYYVGTPTSVDLQPGDVLWKEEHVEIYIGNGMTVGAHGKSLPIPDQISVKKCSLTYYTGVYRFIKN